MMTKEAQEAQNCHRDAAAIVLALLRNDIPTIESINARTSIAELVSGMTSVAALLAVDAHGSMEKAEFAVARMLEKLATAPDDYWEQLAGNRVSLENWN